MRRRGWRRGRRGDPTVLVAPVRGLERALVEAGVRPKRARGPVRHAEEQAQEAFFAWVRGLELIDPAGPWALIGAVPNGARLGMRAAARMKRQGMTPGIPDVVIGWPSPHGCGCWIEAKDPGNPGTGRRGALSPAQRRWLTALRRAGAMTVVAFGLDAMIAATCDYLARPREAGLGGVRVIDRGGWLEYAPDTGATEVGS